MFLFEEFPFYLIKYCISSGHSNIFIMWATSFHWEVGLSLSLYSWNYLVRLPWASDLQNSYLYTFNASAFHQHLLVTLLSCMLKVLNLQNKYKIFAYHTSNMIPKLWILLLPSIELFCARNVWGHIYFTLPTLSHLFFPCLFSLSFALFSFEIDIFTGVNSGICESEGMLRTSFSGGVCNKTCQALYILL